MSVYNQVLTLQKVPLGGFSLVNSTQGITLNSGQQFYIDNVSTAFFPPVSPTSSDPNKYRKQKWLSIGLEGNSFRRYINENINLQGIPSGLEPGHFVYFTIEPKSSLLEQGAGTQNTRNLRYISSLRAKPYMVVENDAQRDNSYERTPSNLFTGVSGNNNFVKFHSSSRYKNLALQSVRFHPIIGHGYGTYNLSSGRVLNIQPKNHHLETFVEVNLESGSRINYGNSSRVLPPQELFSCFASGKGLHVAGALDIDANGIYVANNQTANPSYYVNENNYRIYKTGVSNVFALARPNTTGVSFTIPPDTINFTNIHRTSGALSIAYTYRKFADNTPIQEYPSVGWMSMTGSSENIVVSRMVTSQTSLTDSLYLLSRAARYGSFVSIDPTGSYLSPKFSTTQLPFTKIGKYSRFVTDVRGQAFNIATSNLSTSNLRYFSPYFIFDNQELTFFPYTTSFSFAPQLLIKERINFKRPLSPNLHQAKKVNLKLKFARDDRASQPQKVIKNFHPVEERVYDGYQRVLEFYDEKDNDSYAATPFYFMSGQDFSFYQNETFVYKSRPDFNNPTKQNVVRW